MNTRTPPYAAALVLLALLAVLSGCSLIPASILPGQADPQKWEMPTITVARGKITRVVSATGQISPLDARELAFLTTGGRVKEVAIQKGQVVQEGEVLVQLDTTDLENKLRKAQADLHVAEAQLAEARRPASEADIALAKAQLAYADNQVVAAKFQLNLATELGTTPLEQAVADKQAALRLAQDQLARQDLTANQNEIRRLEYEEAFFQRALRDLKQGQDSAEAQKALQAAQKNLAAARAARAEALRKARQEVADAQEELALAQKELERARAGEVDILAAKRLDYQKVLTAHEQAQKRLDKIQQGPDPDALERAQTAYDAAAAQAENIQATIEGSTLRAPMGGVVFQIYVQPDTWIRAGDPILYMADTSSLYIDAQVSEVDVVNLAVDQQVRVSLDAYPGKFVMGQVTSVDARGQSTSGMVWYQVRVVLEETPSQQVMPGMMASIRVLVGEKEGVLTVPIAALHYQMGKIVVTVQNEDGTWREQPVETGLNDGIAAEVLSGLKEGEIVRIPISAQPPDESGSGAVPGGEPAAPAPTQGE